MAQIVACCHGFPSIKAEHVGLLEQGVWGCPRSILLHALLHLLPHHVGWIVKILRTARKSTVLLLLPKALAILHVIVHHASTVAPCVLQLRHLGGLLRHLRSWALLLLLLLLLLLRRLQALVVLHQKI